MAANATLQLLSLVQPLLQLRVRGLLKKRLQVSVHAFTEDVVHGLAELLGDARIRVDAKAHSTFGDEDEGVARFVRVGALARVSLQHVIINPSYIHERQLRRVVFEMVEVVFYVVAKHVDRLLQTSTSAAKHTQVVHDVSNGGHMLTRPLGATIELQRGQLGGCRRKAARRHPSFHLVALVGQIVLRQMIGLRSVID